MSNKALEIYLEKLAYFETDLAKTADTKQRFSIEHEIEEIKAKIVELGGQIPTPTNPPAMFDARTSSQADVATGATQDFDVFLSHNSSDQATVEELGHALKARGLKVWLADWEVAPGRSWQEALEDVIRTTRSAAVLVSKDGLGPWNDRSMRACLSQFADRGLPVIPVLLPGVSERPALPPFLGLMRWSDFRGGLTAEALDQLQWGITGIKPETLMPTDSRPQTLRHIPEECKILFLASNPTAERLELEREVREIEIKIRAAEHRDTLKLVPKWAVQPDDLLQALNQHQPHIVHFSGHGSPDEEIILQDSTGQPSPVSKRALAALFTTLKDNIRLVILNACYSKPQAKAIVQVVDCVVGMNQAISDRAAIKFSAAFYRALGFGRSVQEAFDQGKTALMLEDIPEEETVELLLRDGVDGSRIVLVGQP